MMRIRIHRQQPPPKPQLLLHIKRTPYEDWDHPLGGLNPYYDGGGKRCQRMRAEVTIVREKR